MRIMMLSNDKLKIVLSKDDMHELAITFETLDYQNIKTREVMLELLDKAKTSTGFDPFDGKLFIEAYPGNDGGCIIYFTAVEENGDEPTHNPFAPVVFAFDNADLLIEASVKLYNQYCHRIYQSALYRYRDGYRLVIYPIDRSNSLTVAFLTEYAQKKGEGELAAALVKEHGQPLIEENAIDVLSSYFS